MWLSDPNKTISFFSFFFYNRLVRFVLGLNLDIFGLIFLFDFEVRLFLRFYLLFFDLGSSLFVSQFFALVFCLSISASRFSFDQFFLLCLFLRLGNPRDFRTTISREKEGKLPLHK